MKKEYKSKLDIIKTQEAVYKIKQHFSKELQSRLSLIKVSAPLFVSPASGFQDTLSGNEAAVSFEVEEKLEIVHSLAKWKRFALMKYGFKKDTGLYTDMIAIRKSETLDEIHSYLVDQWDFEQVIVEENRTKDKLINVITSIYKAIRSTSKYIKKEYPMLTHKLPKSLYIISSEELDTLYKEKDSKEREYLITKEKGAVFIMGIGDKLKSGLPHDKRSPDYDDWKLNGDLLIWSDVLEIPIEILSMGIRVDDKALIDQLDKSNCNDRLSLEYHKLVINKKLPFTIGGGIGQSRLCMLLLEKAHIGEVQASYWTKDIINKCIEYNINLL